MISGAILDTNPASPVTRADLEKQLEINAKVIELQIQISNQQTELLAKLTRQGATFDKLTDILVIIERRTWKTQWLCWGLIVSLATVAGSQFLQSLTVK
jgi:hypothetical protein